MLRLLILSGPVLAVCVGMPSPGLAAFKTGNDLWADCQSGENGNSLSWGLCAGYIEGVADSLIDGAEIAGFRACLPAGVTVGQITDIVNKWLNEHPDVRHYPATSLTAAALSEAFRCR